MARRERKAKTEEHLNKNRRNGSAPPAVDREATAVTGRRVLSGGDLNLSAASSMESQIHRLSDGGATSVQKRELAMQISRAQGNHHLQRIVTSLREAGSAHARAAPATEAVARDVVSDAEQRTGSPRTWPGLPREQFPAVIEAIRNDNGEGAVRALATAVGMPLDRITIQVVDQLGVAGVPGVPTGVGMEVPYVMATPQCSRPPAGRQHWEVHDPGQIQAFIQIGTQLFDPPARSWAPEWVEVNARHRMTKVFSTLMHEYTHFLQDTEQGFHQDIIFLRRGDREFLSHTQGFGGSAVMEALQEIDASASEIENARRTGLTVSPEITNVVTGMWDNYASYHSIVTQGGGNVQNIDVGVARRVFGNIQAARQMLQAYLASAEGRRLGYGPALMRSMVGDQCPRRYNPAWIEPIVRGGGS